MISLDRSTPAARRRLAVRVLGGAGAIAFLVGLTFAIAASANVPAIVLSLFWRRFNTPGMLTGMIVGLASSVLLITISPVVMGTKAIFPLTNPGIISIPLGFAAAIIVSLVTKDAADEATFPETNVRANVGIGAEVAEGVIPAEVAVGDD